MRAADFGALHLPVGAAAVWLGALNKEQCCVGGCGCAWAYNITLNVLSFRNFCCVHVTACAHYLQANDVGQIMRRLKATLKYS